MQLLLMENPHPDLRAYIIWAPFLKGDNEDEARRSTLRYTAPNATYFWVPSQRLSLELGSRLGMASGKPAWDVYLLYPRGRMWDLAVPSPSYWQHQLEVVQGEKFDPVRLRARIAELLGQR